jgi:hypothetical protein
MIICIYFVLWLAIAKMGGILYGVSNEEVSVENPDDKLLIDINIMICNKTNKTQKVTINGQEIEVDCEKNGYKFVKGRKDGKIKILDRYGDVSNLTTDGITLLGIDKELYFFGCETTHDQVIVYITQPKTIIKIVNQSKTTLTVHHRLNGCHVAHANLLEKSYGQYKSEDLQVFTNMGTLIPIREETPTGYFNITKPRVIDNIMIAYSENDDKFIIHDSIF